MRGGGIYAEKEESKTGGDGHAVEPIAEPVMPGGGLVGVMVGSNMAHFLTHSGARIDGLAHTQGSPSRCPSRRPNGMGREGKSKSPEAAREYAAVGMYVPFPALGGNRTEPLGRT